VLAGHWRLPCIGLVAVLLSVSNAQTPEQRTAANLELRLQPETLKGGVPQAFRFELVNISDHDVWAPMPTVQCEDGFDGSIDLSLDFRPLDPGPPGEGFGCAGDRLGWPSILDRVKEWKVLHAGEKLTLTADRAHLHYDSDRAGRYEFWASYSPPSVEPADQAILRQAGIDFPLGKLATQHLVFEKRR
jgi:hypothetical protein